MNNKTDEQEKCFGILDLVFPLGDDGLRHSPEECIACEKKTECLRAAMGKPAGINVEEERVDRAYHSGNMSFFERWAKKKSLYYRRRKTES